MKDVMNDVMNLCSNEARCHGVSRQEARLWSKMDPDQLETLMAP